ncbi:hypothetical protein MKX54_19300 [Alkalihalobacillus sp. FSL R5-0424]
MIFDNYLHRFREKYNEKRADTSVQGKIQRETSEYIGSKENTSRKKRIHRFKGKYIEKEANTTAQGKIQRFRDHYIYYQKPHP